MKINFLFNNKNVEFLSNNRKDLYIKAIDWLYENNYNFPGNILINRILSNKEINDFIKNGTYRKDHFYKIDDDKFLIINSGTNQLITNLKRMLNDFGAKDIKFIGFDNDKQTRIKKFAELSPAIAKLEKELDESPKHSTENPFKQSICVLGKSGSGKSVTIENILENEGHTFEYIIPTAATTGILAQFSPSKSTYVPSRLGNLLLQASKDPENLYTAVFDEMHKSNVIEMINDELLQAISIKRNRGNRFISLDQDTAEMYKELNTKRGNIIIPDNFGFIFISSKPKVIANNPDFFNRVDIVILEEKDRNIDTSDELLDKVLSDEEKSKLSSVRND